MIRLLDIYMMGFFTYIWWVLYMSWKLTIYMSRNHIKYLQDTHQISPEQLPNISWPPIKFHQDTDQISPGHSSNI